MGDVAAAARGVSADGRLVAGTVDLDVAGGGTASEPITGQGEVKARPGATADLLA